MNKTELYNAIIEEWAKGHHNASISRYYPDFQNEYEGELFWNVLNEEVMIWIDDLQEVVKDKFGYSWKFYGYGRNGATIMPDDLKRASACNSYAGIKEECIPEDYKGMLNLYNALKYINKYWNDTAKNITEWWNETKEANGYQEDIDNHEGMQLVTRQVWEIIK